MKRSGEYTLPAILLLVACFLMTAVGNGLGTQTNTMYLNPITQEIGVQRSVFSSLYSLTFLLIVPIMANIAKIKRALGDYRKLAALAFLLNVVGFSVAALSHSFWPFFIYIFSVQLASQIVSTNPVIALINNWFQKNRGLLLGIISAGSSLGGALWSYLAGRWIEGYGFRTSFLISAGITAVCGLYILFAARERPQGTATPPAPVPQKDRGARAALPSMWRNKNALFLGFATFFLVCALQGLRLNAAVILQDAGMDTIGSAGVLSRMLIFGAISKVVTGVLNDRFGTPVTRTVMIFLATIGTVCLIFAGNAAVRWVFSVCFGCGFACMMMLLPIHVVRYFPASRLDEVYGVTSVFVSGGSLLGIPVVNLWYEWTGSYTGVILIYVGFLALSWLLYSRIRLTEEPPATDQHNTPAGAVAGRGE